MPRDCFYLSEDELQTYLDAGFVLINGPVEEEDYCLELCAEETGTGTVETGTGSVVEDPDPDTGTGSTVVDPDTGTGGDTTGTGDAGTGDEETGTGTTIEETGTGTTVETGTGTLEETGTGTEEETGTGTIAETGTGTEEETGTGTQEETGTGTGTGGGSGSGPNACGECNLPDTLYIRAIVDGSLVDTMTFGPVCTWSSPSGSLRYGFVPSQGQEVWTFSVDFAVYQPTLDSCTGILITDGANYYVSDS